MKGWKRMGNRAKVAKEKFHSLYELAFGQI